jgi:competence protein ComFC
MDLLKFIYSVIINALFPITQAEQELFKFTPEQAYASLPKAPKTPLPNTDAIFAYKDERVAKMVWNIKYKKSGHALGLGGYALFTRLSEMELPTGTVLVPIPISPQRRRERGYNQCELLLEAVALLDVPQKYSISKDVLIRTRHVSRQTLKGRKERIKTAVGIFDVRDPFDISPSTIYVVIDDVITTGSTINEAIETLRASGLIVYGLSLAH